MDDRFDERLTTLERELRREDPGLDRALRTGRPRRVVRGWAVLLLTAAFVVLLGGLFAGHGLLLATGLVVAGIAAHLLERPLVRPRHGLGEPPRAHCGGGPSGGR